MSESKNDKKIDKVIGITVTRKALADLFGLSVKRISQLTEEGVLEKVGRGTYDLTKSVSAYITHLKTQTGASDDAKTLTNEKLVEDVKIKRAKAEKEELHLKLMKNELHKSTDVEKMVTGMIINAKSKLDAIPNKLAPRLIDIKDQGYIFDLIQSEIMAVEAELADYDPEDYASEEVRAVDS